MAGNIKEQIIDQMDIPYSREVIEKVIAFQGEDMLRAIKEYAQVEISGFGTIYVSKGKLSRRIARYEKMLGHIKDGLNDENREEEEKRISSLTEKIEFLKTKLRNNE